MENRRFILICLLGVLLFFIWQAWKQDQQAAEPQVARSEQPVVPVDDGDLPTPPSVSGEGLAADEQTPVMPGRAEQAPASSSDVIRIETDVISAEISLTGGDIRRMRLLDYPETRARPEPLPLLDDDTRRWSILQSGVLASPTNLVTQHTVYDADVRELRLADGQDAVELRLTARTDLPYTIEKIYRFNRGDYVVNLRHRVVNNTDEPVSASLFTQIWRNDHILGEQPPFAPTFTGYGLYEERDPGRYRFRKISFGDVSGSPERIEQQDGWLAMMQHYFIIAMLPEPGQRMAYTARTSPVRGYLAQATGEPVTIPAGATHDFDTRLFMGPKLQSRLADIAPGFNLVIDYGILTPLSAPLFWVLNQLHRLVGNWGWAIVLLTLGVKLAMYKLSEAQFRSFAKMRLFAPRIQELRERYGDDRQRMNQAMMDLYKKEGFNPLGGCLPMLVQFPVFIALYWVLLESVELRQAPFFGWITDLSVPDPFYILPLLFGASMWFQQKLSGQMAAMEPMQQRIMMAMPIVLTAFFTLFPAGLVLYWFVSNLVGIAQQWYINRKLDREGLGRKKPA